MKKPGGVLDLPEKESSFQEKTGAETNRGRLCQWMKRNKSALQSGHGRGVVALGETSTRQSGWSEALLDRSLVQLAVRFPVRPTNRSQHCSQASNRTNKRQHSQCNHQEKPGSHVVQKRDHGTSLLLIDSPTPPSALTDPRAHRVHLMKGFPTPGTLASPGFTHLPIKLTRFRPYPHPLSAELAHKISPLVTL